jgi:hypothetical protein
MNSLVEDFMAACEYPGRLDVAAVEIALAEYLKSLGLTRKIVRLEKGWQLAELPPLRKQVEAILDAIHRLGSPSGNSSHGRRIACEARKIIALYTNRPAMAAISAFRTDDARNSRVVFGQFPIKDAQIAHRLSVLDADKPLASVMGKIEPDTFARQIINSQSESKWIHFDLSWFAMTYTGAVEAGAAAVMAWSKPLFDAFLSGAWLLHWTDDTLYWVAKPTVHTEALPRGGRQLHNATGPAQESDVVSRYFWHGVLVPAHVVVNPAQITQEEIRAASNMEVRRVLIERYGYEQYLRDASLTLVDACPDDHLLPGLRTARLFRDDHNQIVLLDMLNSTPESDGSFKRYVISVDGNAYEGRAGKECLAAMASTWRRQSDYSLYFQTPEAYRPMAES